MSHSVIVRSHNHCEGHTESLWRHSVIGKTHYGGTGSQCEAHSHYDGTKFIMRVHRVTVRAHNIILNVTQSLWRHTGSLWGHTSYCEGTLSHCEGQQVIVRACSYFGGYKNHCGYNAQSFEDIQLYMHTKSFLGYTAIMPNNITVRIQNVILRVYTKSLWDAHSHCSTEHRCEDRKLLWGHTQSLSITQSYCECPTKS